MSIVNAYEEILVDDAAALDSNQAPFPKRTRIPRACTTCQKKKIKCDGRTPCVSCTGLSSECYFAPIEKKQNQRKGQLSSNMELDSLDHILITQSRTKYIQALEERLGRMEALLKQSGISTTEGSANLEIAGDPPSRAQVQSRSQPPENETRSQPGSENQPRSQGRHSRKRSMNDIINAAASTPAATIADTPHSINRRRNSTQSPDDSPSGLRDSVQSGYEHGNTSCSSMNYSTLDELLGTDMSGRFRIDDSTFDSEQDSSIGQPGFMNAG